jgi:hypothetical protein
LERRGHVPRNHVLYLLSRLSQAFRDYKMNELETLRLYSHHGRSVFYVCSFTGIVCVEKETYFKLLNAFDEFLWENQFKAKHPDFDTECSSCWEECPKHECPNSKRECGHHCNCSWTQDQCCWCKKEFGEDEEVAA